MLLYPLVASDAIINIMTPLLMSLTVAMTMERMVALVMMMMMAMMALSLE